MALNTGRQVLLHFAGHLGLVHGVADFHRLQVAELERRFRAAKSTRHINYKNLLRTSSVTAQKCRGPIWNEGLVPVAETHGVTLREPAWVSMDAELLALSQPLCRDCKAKPAAPARLPPARLSERDEYYFWLDSYICDMRSAAQIIQAYLEVTERLAGDPLADDLWEVVKKTENTLIIAASCTAENAFREHDMHSAAATKPRLFDHLKRYTPRPVAAAWFGLRPEDLCADCQAATVPQRITTTAR